MKVDSYMITTKYDEGRRRFSATTKKLFNASYFYGKENNRYDNGIQVYNQSKEEGTRAAKNTKQELFEMFLQRDSDYLLILEDDIYINSSVVDPLSLIKSFLEEKRPKLLYLGFNHRDTNSCKNGFEFRRVPKNRKKISGAYAFVISRHVIDKVLMRIRSTLPEKPFDMYSLFYIAEMYPEESYYVSPFIILPDVTTSLIRNPFSQELIWNNCPNTDFYGNILGNLIIRCVDKKKFLKSLHFSAIKRLSPYLTLHIADISDKIDFDKLNGVVLETYDKLQLNLDMIPQIFDSLENGDSVEEFKIIKIK